ncbi:MAG: FAD-dependent monooxygenase, partial [Acetobacteraceae bacterium]
MLAAQWPTVLTYRGQKSREKSRRMLKTADEMVEVLIIGGGQAGIAMSEQLSGYGVPHIILERHRIAERWRSERWDSLV